VREARKALGRLERLLVKVTATEAEVHDRMVERATDAGAMAELSTQLEGLHAEREALETEWLEAAELADG
jgi:ATP-binding cassette subfamily F protein uup